MVEQEKSPEDEEILILLKDSLIPAMRPEFEKLKVEKILNDALRFREITSLNPWAESDLPPKAEEIRHKYSGSDEWSIFSFACRLINLARQAPQLEV